MLYGDFQINNQLFKLCSKPVLPEIVATQHHTYDVLANIMDVSFHCGKNYGALVRILQMEGKTNLS